VAFYLATWSGKTLLLHAHYWQVLHYLTTGTQPAALAPKGEFGRILLLAPNPGLAEQHRRELGQSGIKAVLLSEVKNRLSDPMVFRDTVLVTDMFKLRDKRAKDPSEAESIYYPDLGDRNLVFADEGHKGTARSDSAWRKIREGLTENGMLFEYSATFAQVLSSDALKREYGKRIVFDYQYSYFFRDGYGKRFTPINVDPGATPEADERATLMGGLLLYFQQLRAYRDHQAELAPYHIDRPLWIFVGHTVTKRKDDREDFVDDTETLSDVAKVVAFVKFVLEEPEEARALAWRVLTEAAIIGGSNPFKEKLEPVRGAFASAEALYDALVEATFGGKGALELRLIGAGEIGLKSTGAQRGYFGLINIGDTAKFRKLVEESLATEVHDDPLQGSLFGAIDRPSSPINLLIGSRKFIEGWSSFRVSSMTLLYIGRGEGPQIIQLFGRGVRLLGKDLSLQRSAGTPGAPAALEQLETLFVLGLKADYMSEFLKAVEEEEAKVETVSLPLKTLANDKLATLPVPHVPDLSGFDAAFRGETYPLAGSAAYAPTVNLAPKVFVQEGSAMRLDTKGEQVALEPRHLALLEWPALQERLDAYKRAGRLTHIHTSQRALREVLTNGYYTLIADEADLSDPTFVKQAALEVLKRYLDRFHRLTLNDQQSRTMQVGALDQAKLPSHYTVTTPEGHALLEQLRELAANLATWQSQADTPIPRLYLDPTLIEAVQQPFVYKAGTVAELRISPTPLNEGEARFVRDLSDYWAKRQASYPEVTLYLLRNASRGGLGFHHQTGFYPDFVLWVERAETPRWRVVFIEPHGMRMETDVAYNEKLEVFTDLLPKLNAKTEFQAAGLELDGFVVSQTAAMEIPGLEAYRRSWPSTDDWDYLAQTKRLLVPEGGREENIRRVLGV
jgi:hypothetical protein